MSHKLIFEYDQGGPSSLTISLLYKNFLLRNRHIALEKLNYLRDGDSEWETSHDQAFLLIVRPNIV